MLMNVPQDYGELNLHLLENHVYLKKFVLILMEHLLVVHLVGNEIQLMLVAVVVSESQPCLLS